MHKHFAIPRVGGLLVATLAAMVIFSGGAAADHVQRISQESAAAFCSHHGGGTECDFCAGKKLPCHSLRPSKLL